jgi:hypothetical protein
MELGFLRLLGVVINLLYLFDLFDCFSARLVNKSRKFLVKMTFFSSFSMIINLRRPSVTFCYKVIINNEESLFKEGVLDGGAFFGRGANFFE